MPETPDGRAVSTTELTASTAAERNALTHLAADARMLSHHKHPNFVPIVEARWMAANRLAIIRARVRGSTLRQALDAVGPMPEARTIEVLTDVGGVLDWAARGNVVHRTVTSDCVCFQKGSGRVMVSFGLPASLDATPARPGEDGSGFLFERCADGATLARLAYEMLTAHRASDTSIESLKAVRPDVSPEMVAAIEAGLSCANGGPAMTAPQFLAMLPVAGAESHEIGAAAVATAASAPVVPRAARTPLVAPVIPLAGPAVGARGDTAATTPPEPPRPEAAPAPARPVAVPPTVQDATPAYAAPRRRRGRGLLIASMLGLVLLLGTAFALIQSERGRDEARIAANQRDDESAGDIDVALTDTLAPDPDAMTSADAPGAGAPGAGADPSVGGAAGTTGGSPGGTSLPSSLPSNRTQPLPGSLPESRETAPRATAPQAQRTAAAPVRGRAVPRAAAGASTSGASACDSPSMASQRACLSAMIEVSDRELNGVYQALLQAVRTRSGEEAEEHVRVQQRAWLVRRDEACRNPSAKDGTLWARERAACLARESDARALQLARALAAIRS